MKSMADKMLKWTTCKTINLLNGPLKQPLTKITIFPYSRLSGPLEKIDVNFYKQLLVYGTCKNQRGAHVKTL